MPRENALKRGASKNSAEGRSHRAKVTPKKSRPALKLVDRASTKNNKVAANKKANRGGAKKTKQLPALKVIRSQNENRAKSAMKARGNGNAKTNRRQESLRYAEKQKDIHHRGKKMERNAAGSSILWKLLEDRNRQREERLQDRHHSLSDRRNNSDRFRNQEKAHFTKFAGPRRRAA